MKPDQEFWDWLWEDDEEVAPPPPQAGRGGAVGTVSPGGPEETQSRAEAPAVVPSRVRRSARRRSTRRARLLTVLGATVAAGAIATVVVVLSRVSGPSTGPGSGSVPLLGDQRVVAWAVWDEKAGERPFVAVLASGGGRQPVAVAVPGNTVVSIPGRSLGTVDQAADDGDVAVVAATVENILGVQVDDGWGIDMGTFRRLVDALGGIRAGFEELDGAGTAAYLRDSPAIERAIRWQEVLAGLLGAIEAAPNVLGELPDEVGPPEDVRPVLSAGSRDVLILPVEDVGAGLADLDEDALQELVDERFVATGSEEKVRLVVLNGNGTPGIGTEVARLLVPEGFELVASTNADAFDQEETVVVASSIEFLDDAQRAQQLLGVGEVRLGRPSGLADVLVVVGKDFTMDDPGGP
jgi:hypothetical protein